jgi:hypothetical protein
MNEINAQLRGTQLNARSSRLSSSRSVRGAHRLVFTRRGSAGCPTIPGATRKAITSPIWWIDVETVGLHENGHSLELGDFGPPPTAVMNPVYGGIRHTPSAIDHAGMCAVWDSWPNQ